MTQVAMIFEEEKQREVQQAIEAESNGFQTADNSENDWKGISHRGDYVPGV